MRRGSAAGATLAGLLGTTLVFVMIRAGGLHAEKDGAHGDVTAFLATVRAPQRDQCQPVAHSAEWFTSPMRVVTFAAVHFDLKIYDFGIYLAPSASKILTENSRKS